MDGEVNGVGAAGDDPERAARRDPARRFGPSGGRPVAAPPRAAPSSAAPSSAARDPRRERDGEPTRRPRPAPPRAEPPPAGSAPTEPARASSARTEPARTSPPGRSSPGRPSSGRPDGRPARDRRPQDRAPADRPPRDRPPRDRPAWPGDGDDRRDGGRDDGPGRRRSAARTARALLAVASALVFGLTGVAWVALGSVTSSSALTGPVGTAADGATDILLVGVDSRTDAQGQPLPRNVLAELGASATDGSVNTDTMILVRIPNDGSRAVAFSIPRDSYVTIPGAGRRDKINSAYPGAKAEAASQLVGSGVTDPREVDVRSSEAGRQELVKAVSSLTGLTVDHFAEVNLLGFYNLTAAIGGVDVCLKGATDDALSGARFRAGPQTVAGRDALAFVRQRHGLPQGDLDRIRRQQAFLAGLSRKVLSGGTLADPITLSRLVGAVKQSVVLDGNWDVLGFAQQMQNVSAGSVAFLTIPTQGTGDVDGRGDVVRVDPTAVQRFVSDAIGPEEPAADDGGPPPQTIPVDVRNATRAEGAAARVVAVLSAQGFSRATSGNAEDTATRSEVRVAPGADAAGARVARALGGLPTRPDPTLAPGSVRAVLTADYRGPGAAPGASTRPSSSAAAAPAPPPPPAITAGGVSCVN